MGRGKPKREKPIEYPPMTPETFWGLISNAANCCGNNQDAFRKHLRLRLSIRPPEHVLDFDRFLRAYMGLADRYGLRCAAFILCRGCMDGSFAGFRAWLISKGRRTYMTALEDPDTLADVWLNPEYGASFGSLRTLTSDVYEERTGENLYRKLDRDLILVQMEELRPSIPYGEGIDYPYKWSEIKLYLPKLCAKYVPPEELARQVAIGDDPWDLSDPSVAAARKEKRHPRVEGGMTT